MSVDLWMLLWAVLLTFVQMAVAAAGVTSRVGVSRAVGNREDMPALGGWRGRAIRAHRNMLESLPLFIALVLIAHLSGKAGPETALGAQVFFYARLAYALVYFAGIPWLRTLLWVVSAVGLAIMFLALLA